MEPIKVFIVDDSAVVRSLLTEKLNKTGIITVVGSALDPFIARDKITKTEVDVLLLDIEMPRMDGLTFLKYLMKYYPIPTIILSSLTDGKNQASLEALSLGAIQVLSKPGGPYSVAEMISDLTETISLAARVDLGKLKAMAQTIAEAPTGHRKILSSIRTTRQLIAVGASTGGTIALEHLFKGFNPDFPPTLAVIHMPPRFTASFAKRLDDLCEVRVKEAEDGEKALVGHVYIAPGDFHMAVQTSGADYVVRILEGPKIYNQRPAVDILFRSVAEQVGRNSLGVLLTGMGKDGAEGLLKMKDQGAFTIGQDEASSIVYGMPKEAFEIGATSIQLPLDKIASELGSRLSNR